MTKFECPLTVRIILVHDKYIQWNLDITVTEWTDPKENRIKWPLCTGDRYTQVGYTCSISC